MPCASWRHWPWRQLALRWVEAQREQEAREAAEAQERKALGVTTAFEDWKRARDVLKVRVSAVSTSCLV